MHPRLARFASCSALAVLLAASGCQSSGKRSHAPDADTQREIHAMLDEYTRALMKRDAPALDRIWADDLTFINLRGELLTKRNRMDNIKSGATAFASIRLSEEQIRSYGQTAVATFRAALDARYSGQEGSGEHRVTMVWTRTKGTWQMVAVQMTPITR